MFGILCLLLVAVAQRVAAVSYPCNASAPCGCSANPVVMSRILVGESAATLTWEWAVSVSFNGSRFCGGTLISSSWALATAGQHVTLQRISSDGEVCRQVLDDSVVQSCAFGDNGTKGVCQGDPGGAVMMFTSSHQWVLIGLISYGYLCYNRGFPTLRIRIKAFLRWMQSMNVTDTFTMSTNATATTITTRLTTVSRTTTSTRRATKTTKNASHRFPLCFCLLVVAILVNLGKARIE